MTRGIGSWAVVRLPGISNNVGPVKHFLSTLLSFHLKEFFSFVFFCFLSSLHRRPRLACNLSVGFSVRPKHLFDQNFDHDYYCKLPLARERDDHSLGRRSSSRDAWYRAVPRANRT